MGLVRKEIVGKGYDPVSYEVTEKGIRAYGHSYGNDRPQYREIAPLMFAVVYSFEASLRPLFDAALSADLMRLVRRLVRGSLDVQAFATVRPGDVITSQAKVESLDDKGSGELLQIDTLSHNQRGDQVALVKNF